MHLNLIEILLILISFNCFCYSEDQLTTTSSISEATNSSSSSASVISEDDLDPVELTAKLLIELDEKIEKYLEESNSSLKVKYPQLYIPPNENEIANARDEKFSEVIKDLTSLENQIRDAINDAMSKRKYGLVARLRPILTYVSYIRTNMDSLRSRVVAVAALSTIAANVNQVVDRFADVMTSADGLSGNINLFGNININNNKNNKNNNVQEATNSTAINQKS